MKHGARYAFVLSPMQAEMLARRIAKIETRLRRYSFSPVEIRQLIQTDPHGVCERRSCVCPYEQLRALKIVQRIFSEVKLSPGPWFVTLGDPRRRLRPRDLGKFDPKKVLRRWNEGLKALRTMGLFVVGFCVVELGLCRLRDRPAPGEPRHFYEPHFHGDIWGATKAQIKAAFKVRPLRSTSVRRRALKVKPVTDLNGLIEYHLKFIPQRKVQYQDKRGDSALRWGRSRFPEQRKSEWYRAMSRYRVAGLLSATDNLLGDLGRAGYAELS